MPSEDKDIHFLLGQLSGKMDTLFVTASQSSQAFTSHATADEKNFEDISDRLSDVNKEIGKIRERFAYYVGAAAVAASILSLSVPKIIDLL